MFEKKKGQMASGIWALVGVVVAFIVIGLLVAFGNMILSDTRTDIITDTTGETATCNASSGVYTGCSDAVAGTTDSIEANNKISSKSPLLATVIIAVTIIGFLIVGFAGFMAGRR